MSNIDPTVPIYGSPTTQSVRTNFQIAHDEITALQNTGALKTDLAAYLPLAGGTLSGMLTLSAGPTATLHPASKGYVDANITAVTQGAATLYLPLAGGHMTGSLLLAHDATQPLEAVTLEQLQAATAGGGGSGGASISIGDAPPASPATGALWWDSVGGQLYLWFTDANSSQWVIANNLPTGAGAFLPLTGGTMSGMLTLSADPTAILHAATKHYVDTKAGNYLPLAGGTLTGALSVGGALNLATSQVGDWQFSRSGDGWRHHMWRTDGWQDQWFETSGTRLWSSPTAQLMSLDGSGNLSVNGTITTSNVVYCNAINFPGQPGGNHNWSFLWAYQVGSLASINMDNGGTVYALANGSDARLKTDIARSTHDCLATVRALELHEFGWLGVPDPWRLKQAKRDGTRPKQRVGLIAQRLHGVFPEGVLTGDDFDDHLGRVWSLDQNAMIALLVGAVQQLTDRIAVLEGAVG